MTHARHLLVPLVGALVVGCSKRQLPNKQASDDSILEAARARVLADTNSDAYRELNLMTAPIDRLAFGSLQSDSVRWTAPDDSCVLVVLTPVATHGTIRSDGSYIAGEWFGTTGFGDVTDIAPSPGWRWIAYGRVDRAVTDAGVDSLAAMVHASRADVLSRAIAQPDGSRLVVIPVVEHLVDACAGDACELEAASPALGGFRVGWTSRGDALVAGQEVPPHWVALDPETRKPVKRDTVEPLPPVRWINRSLSRVMNAHDAVRTPSGAYAFSSRHDSIFVRGPDRNGRTMVRFVGSGAPVTSTRNGEYLLAVQRTPRGLQAVMYAFRLQHTLMPSSCDR